jgi:tRNA(His) guanylyltransferase
VNAIDRFKALEDATNRTLTHDDEFLVLRLDGRAFHTYTKTLTRPYDQWLNVHLVVAAKALCQDVSGARLAYVQSDEVSVIAHDPSGWFGGDVQKIVSVAASTLTAHFVRERRHDVDDLLPSFDARVLTLPTVDDVLDYVAWRQHDAQVNSASSLAACYYHEGDLWNVPWLRRVEMLRRDHGVVWEDQSRAFRQGSLVFRRHRVEDVRYTHKRTGEVHVEPNVLRHFWSSSSAPLVHDVRPKLADLLSDGTLAADENIWETNPTTSSS